MSKKRRASRHRTETPPPPVVETQEPAIETMEPATEPRGGNPYFWPEGKTMPGYYVKARARQTPCPSCRRVALDTGSQAVVCQNSGNEVAFFRYKACEHRFSMPVKEV